MEFGVMLRSWIELKGANGQKGRTRFGCSVTHFSAQKAPKMGIFWIKLGQVKHFVAVGTENLDKYWFLLKNNPILLKLKIYFIITHKMTKKVEKTTRYRLFFEIF